MRSPRVAVSVGLVFFGMTVGSLLPRMSAIKYNLGLTDGQVGLAFLIFGVGAVVSAGAARFVLARGARRPVRVLVFALCALLATQGLAPNFTLLAASFLAVGLCVGSVDMLLNSQATEIERDAGRPMINSFHGYWSLGSIIGSVLAVGAAAASIPPAVHLSIVGLALAVASIPLVARVPDTRGGAAVLIPPGSGRWHLGTAVAVISVLALVAVVVEGAGGDWSAIYLRDFGHAPEAVAALGFGALSLTMTAVRFVADRLTAVTGVRGVAALGGLVTGLGFLVAVVFPMPALAIAGFALVGIGSAVLFPLAMTAASNMDESGTALSVATAVGYAGSLVGPPLIGAAADHFGLRLALLIPAGAGFVVFGMMAATRVLSARTTRRSSDAAERVEPEA